MTSPLHLVSPEKAKTWKTISHNLVLHLPTGIYYVRKYRSGRGRLFKSTHQKTLGKARNTAEQMIEDWLGIKKPKARRQIVSVVVDELEASLEQEFINGDRRVKTREHDKSYLPIIKKYFGEDLIDEIDEDYWDEWVRNTGKKLERSTLFDVAKYLSKTMTFAYRKKYVGRKPVIKNPDKKPKKGRVYTDAEVKALVEAADPKTLSQIFLGYECGLRSYEVRCLRKAWLRHEGDKTYLSLPEDFVKANAREILLSPGATKYLRQVLKSDRTGSPYVYPAPKSALYRCETSVYQNRRWRSVVTKAKLHGERPWFRYLRHSFYNKVLLELGLPIQNVSQYGGTSIRTLQGSYLTQDPERTASVAQAISIRGKDD